MRATSYLALILLCPLALADEAVQNPQCVVLLHGMVRTASSMEVMAEALRAAGYEVQNVDYPSRDDGIEVLAPAAVTEGITRCGDAGSIHFVTHSLGGILVRHYLKHNPLPRLGRVVMLAPPNQGSEVVDALREMPGFELLNGPSGLQLGTGTDSVPLKLGPVDYAVGVIAGTASVNLFLSQFLPDPDDGKVSLANTKVEGMTDFLAVPHSHPFIMRAPAVIEQTIHFLRHGSFLKPPRTVSN